MKQKVFVACGAVVLLLGIIFIACSSDSSNLAKVTGDFRVMSTDITSCKTETRSADEGEDDEYVHVLEYEAKRDGTLHLKDVNRVVSCSSQGIEVEAKLEGNVIIINEHEISDDIASTCVCPVDFDMVVGPLEEGDYILNYCVDGMAPETISLTYSPGQKGKYEVKGIAIPPHDIEADGIWYNITSKEERTVEVTYKLDGYSGDVVIPEQVTYKGNTYTVTGIAAYTFCGTKAKSLYIPNTVKVINGEYAFAFSGNLESIHFPEGITEIPQFACQDCIKLSSVVIPQSITTIPSGLFQGCLSLQEVTMHNNIGSIGWAAFRQCESLTSVIIPEGLNTLEAGVFSGSGLESIVIPMNITKIARRCFASCRNLKSVEIGRNVEALEEAVFEECPYLSRIFSLNPAAPKIEQSDYGVFDDSVLQNATLYVPKGSKEAYSTAEYWNRFVHIEEIKD